MFCVLFFQGLVHVGYESSVTTTAAAASAAASAAAKLLNQISENKTEIIMAFWNISSRPPSGAGFFKISLPHFQHLTMTLKYNILKFILIKYQLVSHKVWQTHQATDNAYQDLVCEATQKLR